MTELLRHVAALAEEIGPRPAASSSEAKAARYIAQAARQYTHQAWLEPFRTFVSAGWQWLLILGLSLAGGLAIWWRPLPAFILTAAAATGAAGRVLGLTTGGWPFWQRASQNVVAVVPAVADLRRRVVLIAHYDTGRRPPVMLAGAKGRTIRGVLATCILALPLLMLANLVWPAALWGWCEVPLLAGLTAATVVLVLWELEGQPVSGALDNGSGVAVALHVGDAVARSPLQHTELWSVLTGCKAAGMAGVHAFLDRYGPMLADAIFVVLEQVGSPALCYGPGVGRGLCPQADAAVLGLIGDLSASHPEWGMTAAASPGWHTEVQALLARGYRAVAIVGGGEAQAVPGARGVEPATMAGAAALLEALALAVDREASDEKKG